MPEPLRRAEQDRYDASIASVDAALGDLFAGLGRRGLAERTIVVVTSDHGEEHGERGRYTHAHSVTPAATVLDLAGLPAEPAMAGTSLARYWQDSTTPSEAAFSSLFNGPDTAYSIILGDLQYRVRNGIERLQPATSYGPAPVDLLHDPAYHDVAARGRRLLDSILRQRLTPFPRASPRPIRRGRSGRGPARGGSRSRSPARIPGPRPRPSRW